MSYIRAALLAGAVFALAAVAESAQQSQATGQTPPAQQPAAASVPQAGTVSCPAPTPPATLPANSFTATTGLLLHQVPTTKVQDFETFLGHLRDALARSTDPTVRKQASGWRVFRDTALGPNGDVVYVFLLDPAVPCVDYALGPIIAAAFPDAAKASEVWGLFKQSVRSGGTLMNLVPAGQSSDGVAPAARQAAPGPTPAGAPAQRTEPSSGPPVPLDANPTRPPR